MPRLCLPVILTFSMLAPLLLGAASAVDDSDTPALDDEAASAAFEAGRELFESGDYPAAEKKFKASQKSADKTAKKVIGSWIKACQGGKKLTKVISEVEKEKWGKAWSGLEKLRKGYHRTPLRSRLEELTQKVEPELFTILSTFEEPAPEPEKNAGERPDTSKINTDEKYVRRGERSLEWRESVGLQRGATKLIGWLPLARFEGGTLQQHRRLHLSIFSPDKDFGKFTIFFDTGDADTQNPLEVLRSNCFFHHLTINHVGWKDIVIDLDKKLSSGTESTREEMVRLSLLIIPPSKPKLIYLDEIKLEKR